MINELNALTGDTSNTLFYILIGVALLGILGLTVLPKLFNNNDSKNDRKNDSKAEIAGSLNEEKNVAEVAEKED